MTVISLSLVLICAIIALLAIGGGTFLVLVKLGVIFNEARRPAFDDRSSYSLDQGREVRPEEERQRRS